MYCTPGPANSNLINTENAVPRRGVLEASKESNEKQKLSDAVLQSHTPRMRQKYGKGKSRQDTPGARRRRNKT